MAAWRASMVLAAYLLAVATCASLESSDEDYSGEGRKKKKQEVISLFASKETAIPNFVRLVAMRLVFSLAYMVGLGDWASGLFGGALAPPGSDYDDDYGDYRDDGGDDYDDY